MNIRVIIMSVFYLVKKFCSFHRFDIYSIVLIAKLQVNLVVFEIFAYFAAVEYEKHIKNIMESDQILLLPSLPSNITLEDVMNIFAAYGPLDFCGVDTSNPRYTSAHVKFFGLKDAEKAHSAVRDGKVLFNGTVISLNMAEEIVDNGVKQEVLACDVDESESNTTNYIDNINDDCLIQVFQRLSDLTDRLNVEKVCKRWQRVSNHIWNNVRAVSLPKNSQKEITRVTINENMNILVRSGRFLSYLELNLDIQYIKLRTDILTIITTHCRNIETLVISSKLFVKPNYLGRITSNVLQQLPNLANLSLDSMLIEEDEMHAIASKTNLTSLALTDCYVKGLNEIAKLSNLRYLDVAGIREVTNNFLIIIANYCTHLEHLDVSCGVNIDHDGIQALSKLENLKILCLNSSQDVFDEDLLHLINVEALHLQFTPTVTNSGIYEFVRRAKNLRLLNIYMCRVTSSLLHDINNFVKTNRVIEEPLHIIIHDSAVEKFFNVTKRDQSPHLLIEIWINEEAYDRDYDYYSDDSM